jgi:hypothetical protein
MATPNLSYQNKFTTTLSAGIAASDTTISLTNLPTPAEGYLVIEPDSSTNWEEIYYTSKTGSAVVCPSAAAGRGVGGSTAASHSSGATVRMDSTAELFSTLQDATALTGVHTNNTNYGFDFVASGCVWSGDSYGSTKAASMTSGVVYINGRKHTVAAVTSRTFTASKDTYIDLLYSTIDNVATPVYTEVTNNAASPALAANSVRIGIIVTGASNIASSGSVNQGQETMVLPIASSVAYSVTDSLGNLICPRDAQRKVLGMRQITSNFTTASASAVQITGLSVPVIVPTGRKVKITGFTSSHGSVGVSQLGIWDGTVGSGALLINANSPTGAASSATPTSLYTPGATSKTYNLSALSTSGTTTVAAGSTSPAYILVELD